VFWGNLQRDDLEAGRLMTGEGHILAASVLLGLAALSSLVLGVLVLVRNPQKRTHRVFALLTMNIFLWSVGVFLIVHSPGEAWARTWIMATFAVAAFLPATFYHFIAFFPSGDFRGVRPALWMLYAGALILVLLQHSPWYIQSITVMPDAPPQVDYGPVMLAYLGLILLSMAFSFTNLFGKLWESTGIHRRQIEHVLISIFASTVLASLTNVLGPLLNIQHLELYGPCFMVLLMGGLAYAMVRYQLLDIWHVISRTSLYAVMTAAVILIFLGVVSGVHYAFSAPGQPADILTTTFAALIVVLLIQPLKERVQLRIDRLVLHRRYDSEALLERISQRCARFVQLPELLEGVARELQQTIGLQPVRVLLVADNNGTVVTEFCTEGDTTDTGTRYPNLETMMGHIEESNEPLVLGELMHARATPERMRMAEELTELGAQVLVPLKTKLNTVGLLVLGEKNTRDIYTQEDLRVLGSLATPLATTIENTRLYTKLGELNLHLERILSSMRGGVVAVDPEGKITTINHEARSILGELAVGATLDTLEPRVAQLLRRTLKEHRNIRDYETVITSADGTGMPVALASAHLSTPEKKSAGAMVLIYNMTQIKRLESNVQRADRLTSIGTMAAGMAHEIKNPLQSIKTFSQLLLARFDDPDFRKTFTEVVPPEVQRIDTIVSRLLDFARPKPVCFMPQNLQEVIQDVLALLENQLRKAAIDVVIQFPAEAKPITGDDQQLHQVFLNLLLNAIDAMTHSPRRELHIQVLYERAHITRHLQPPMLDVPCARVLVSDTGCGMSEEDIRQLFTPFFTTKDHGTGLGLSVVHGIISEHGGEIEVTSTPNSGTTFCVTFPLSDTAAVAERVGA